MIKLIGETGPCKCSAASEYPPSGLAMYLAYLGSSCSLIQWLIQLWYQWYYWCGRGIGLLAIDNRVYYIVFFTLGHLE